MDKVRVELGQRSYPIYIGSDIFSLAGKILKRHVEIAKVMVITNTTVGALYLQKLIEGLNREGLEAYSAVVPDGEEYKTLEWASRLYEVLFDHNMGRDDTIVALGGGVIGDLVGFVAATYKRGLPFLQVPTTLLAQVDASVGGKVAVDHSRGKNMIGAFYQPICVLVNLDVLNTLPAEEIRNGLAEVIKYGIIRDSQLFGYLEENVGALLEYNTDLLRFVVKRSCEIKALVVARDERELGLREILNFGHTLGHAIEAATGYRLCRHGEAVAIGMVCATEMALRLKMSSEKTLMRITELIVRAGLPTRSRNASPDEIIKYLRHDKKIRDNRVRFVLPRKIGQVTISDAVPENLIRDVLEEHNR